MPAEPPDLRIVQANERTALAWIRTSLALMAFGFAVARTAVWMAETSAAAPGLVLGVALVVAGTLTSVVGTFRYVRTHQAVVTARPMVPGTRAVSVLAGGVVLLGVGLAVYLALG